MRGSAIGNSGYSIPGSCGETWMAPSNVVTRLSAGGRASERASPTTQPNPVMPQSYEIYKGSNVQYGRGILLATAYDVVGEYMVSAYSCFGKEQKKLRCCRTIHDEKPNAELSADWQ